MFNFNANESKLELKNNIPFSKSGSNSIHKFDGLNLINPKEIMDFIKDKDGLIEFISEVHVLIKNHFPNANLYLEFVEDPEIEDLNSLFTSIVITDYAIEEAMRIYNDLICNLIELSDYQKYSNYYCITTLEDFK